MTEEKRTEQLEHVGAVNLHVDLTSGEIHVRVANTDVAEVTLEPMFAGDEVALRLIAETRIDMDGSTVKVIVPKPPNTVVGMQTVYGNGNVVVGNVVGNVVSAGDVYGGIFIGSGRTMHVGGMTVAGTPGQVRVTATVPADSHVTGKTVSADMSVYPVSDGAQAAETVFTSTGGDLSAVASRRVNAHSISGDITADGSVWMHANSTSGDIRAESLSGRLDARSISGDIRVHARGDATITASSVSGDITVTRAHGVTVSVDAGSVSGRVRT